MVSSWIKIPCPFPRPPSSLWSSTLLQSDDDINLPSHPLCLSICLVVKPFKCSSLSSEWSDVLASANLFSFVFHFSSFPSSFLFHFLSSFFLSLLLFLLPFFMSGWALMLGKYFTTELYLRFSSCLISSNHGASSMTVVGQSLSSSVGFPPSWLI